MTMMRWSDNATMIVQLRDEVIVQWYDSNNVTMMTRWCDSNDAMLYHVIVSFLLCHRHCIIALLHYRLFCAYAIEKRNRVRQ